MNIRILLKKKKKWGFLYRSCCWEAEEKANEKILEEDWGEIREEKNVALNRIEDLEEQLI